MFEYEISGNVCQFNFGMRFLKDINKRYEAPVEGVPGKTQSVGLRVYVARLLDGDVEALADVLYMANMGQTPRVRKEDIDNFIENEVEDIDTLFDEVLGFLKSTNCTKKVTVQIVEAVETQQEIEKIRQERMLK